MLTVSAGILSPSFSPSTTSYTVEVPLSVLELTVVATAADAPWASVAVSPAQPMTLSEGTNSVTVTVTAEDGTQTSCSLEITRHEMLDCWSPNLGAMMYVPAGTFQRDSTASNLSTVSAFRMSRHEITRAQWVAVTGWADPSYVPYSSGLDDPVQQVSWYDVIAFCNKLSLLEGLTPVYTVSGVNFPTLAYAQIPTTTASAWDTVTVDWNANGYRLPTEMEWMWVAMGSDLSNPGEVNTTGWLGAFSGSTGSNDIGDHVVFGFDSGEPGATTTSRTEPVGSRLGNVLGLVDLSGNIREWVWDWYGSYPAGAVTDYHGMPSGENRGHRGGGWDDYSSWCTVAYRNYYFPFYRGYNFGFRVVRP